MTPWFYRDCLEMAFLLWLFGHIPWNYHNIRWSTIVIPSFFLHVLC